MDSLQNFDYNGQPIQRREDGYLSLNQMCGANGKLVADFLRLKSTKAYIAELSASMGIPIDDIVESKEGAMYGTWGHPFLALRCAQWISPKFAVWCDAHIFNLMETGQTSLAIDPIEEMRLKIELARLEAQKSQTDLALISLRNTIVQTCPEPVQQKILGYQTVEKIEYRDRVIVGDRLINDGDTATKTELCHRYKFLSKTGKPNYRQLNAMLESVGMDTNSPAWDMSATIQENYQFKREYLPELDRRIIKGDRQLNLGE